MTTKINYEKMITEAILGNRIVYVEKHNDVVFYAKTFKNKEELIKWYNNSASDYTEMKYFTAVEAYKRACNQLFITYLEKFEEPYEYGNKIFTEDEVQNIFRNMSSYDDVTKNIKVENFFDGIYEGNKLMLPINLPLPSKVEILEMIAYDDFSDPSLVKVTREIY